MAQHRLTTLEQTVAAVSLRYGPAALTKATCAPLRRPALPTGLPALDGALAGGGLPRGRISELIGPLSAGATTLAARIVAGAQRLGEGVAYLDLAGAADADGLARCGVDLQRLPVIRPHHSRQALEIALTLVARQGLGLLVLDAVGDLWQAPADGRWAAAALRRLLGRLRRSSCAFLALHHGRAEKLCYPPGFSLQAHAWLRLELQQVRWLRRMGDVWGCEAEVLVVQQRNGREGQRVRINIDFGGMI
ncbi:MAG TPA: hypothetical protein PLJ35_02300 [Anaerolineae bacterium]|nr:hypothetical protein [Anaerolineae bacterium]HOQ97636.1 hypothetical protein [Anaerolineae bacterium]HPL27834.1 hypothetical protein [Anaerolineae bacterium]